MKKANILFSILIICSILITGCVGGASSQILSSEKTPGVNNTPDIEADSSIEEDGEAQIVEGAFEPSASALSNMGNADFQVNPEYSVSGEYTADGTELTLSLTDASGLIWQLSIPGNALDYPTTIKMTALNDVKSNDIPLDFKGGVLLEPDGLQFFQQAKLSLRDEGSGSKGFMFTGAQDGTGMDLALPDEDPSAGVLLSHFSSVIVGSADDEAKMQKLGQYLDNADKAAIAEAKELLKNKDIRVPQPPSLPIECVSEETEKANQKILENYILSVRNPESTIITKLLSIKRSKALIGNEYDENFTLEKRLLYRLEKKARLLIKQYYGKPEKLMAVSKTALSIAYDMSLLGAVGSTEAVPFIEEIGNWCDLSVDQLINDIIEQHDYKKADAVWMMARWAELLGVHNKSVELIQRKLQGALNFKLQNQLNLHYPKQEWQISSQGEVKINQAINDPNYMIGSATGHYDFYTVPDSIPMIAPDFPISVTIRKFDACKGTAEISIDRFFADSEEYDLGGEDGKQSLSIVKTAFPVLYSDYLLDGTYTFPVILHNLDANAVDETVDGNAPNAQGKVQSEFLIKLIHTPKHYK